jgi:hypothetical protein
VIFWNVLGKIVQEEFLSADIIPVLRGLAFFACLIGYDRGKALHQITRPDSLTFFPLMVP